MAGVAKDTTPLGGPLNVSSDFQMVVVIFGDCSAAPALAEEEGAAAPDSEAAADDAENILCVGCTTSFSSHSSTLPPAPCSVATRMASQSSRFTKLIPEMDRQASSAVTAIGGMINSSINQ